MYQTMQIVWFKVSDQWIIHSNRDRVSLEICCSFLKIDITCFLGSIINHFILDKRTQSNIIIHLEMCLSPEQQVY